jgi:hypothetical protein
MAKTTEEMMDLRTEAGVFGYVAFIAWIGAIIVIFRRLAKAIMGLETYGHVDTIIHGLIFRRANIYLSAGAASTNGGNKSSATILFAS